MDHVGRTTHSSEIGLEAISSELFGREPWLLFGEALILIHDRQTGAVVDCNETALDLLKLPFIGDEPLTLEHMLRAGAPHDRSAFEAHLERTRTRGSQRFQWHTCATDGSPIYLDVTTQLVTIEGRPRIVCVGRDISEQVLTRRALERAEAFLNAAIDRSPAGIILVRQGETVDVSVNPAGREILGLPGQLPGVEHGWLEETGKTYDLRNAEGHPFPENMGPVERALRHGVQVQNESVRLHNGTGVDRWLLANAAPVFGPSGETLGAIGVFSDVTDLKEQERQREALSEQLIRAQRLQALSQLAAGVAHEINNPLMGILNYSDLVDLQAESPTLVRGHAAKIANLCDRIAGIVQDLATFANAEREVRDELSLSAIIESCVLMLGARTRHANVQVHVTVEDAGLRCHGDGGQLRQVLINLLQNAITAMESNATTKPRELRIRCVSRSTDGREELECSVSDTGSGMSSDTAERAFHPFFTTHRAGASTGLGLSVSHSIIQEHGGTLTFDTREGEGSVFRFTLPAFRRAAEPEPENPWETRR